LRQRLAAGGVEANVAADGEERQPAAAAGCVTVVDEPALGQAEPLAADGEPRRP
jgi:hypothetical protein